MNLPNIPPKTIYWASNATMQFYIPKGECALGTGMVQIFITYPSSMKNMLLEPWNLQSSVRTSPKCKDLPNCESCKL